MKNFIITTIIISLLFLLGLADHNYMRRNCRIVEVDCIEVGAVDQQGYRWNFKADNLQVGDTVTLIMHDSFTIGDITDDIVKGVK